MKKAKPTVLNLKKKAQRVHLVCDGRWLLVQEQGSPTLDVYDMERAVISTKEKEIPMPEHNLLDIFSNDNMALFNYLNDKQQIVEIRAARDLAQIHRFLNTERYPMFATHLHDDDGKKPAWPPLHPVWILCQLNLKN